MKTAIASFCATAAILFASAVPLPKQIPTAEPANVIILARHDVLFCDPPPRWPGPTDEHYRAVGNSYDAASVLRANIYDLVECFRRELESS